MIHNHLLKMEAISCFETCYLHLQKIVLFFSTGYSFLIQFYTDTGNRSPSLEADGRSACHEIPRIIWKYIYYCAHRTSPLMSILNYSNAFHTPMPCLLKYHFNIIHPSPCESLGGFILPSILIKLIVNFVISPMLAMCSSHFVLLIMSPPNNILILADPDVLNLLFSNSDFKLTFIKESGS